MVPVEALGKTFLILNLVIRLSLSMNATPINQLSEMLQ